MAYRNAYYAEYLRRDIVEAMLATPTLGENYIDWHADDGTCGLTLIIDGEHFDITIVKRAPEEVSK